ncbi:diphosphate--fructose-6-phosphate 1-phosphotransferase [Bacillus sp. RAR_GA_16]|uniref:diphosphate--fructose-6-phosphate 1-phosphotransferase n=1 Tax=Bacillus sp. RAR_GA_16 TaxID=2876774 RepID=UPI001CCE465C|nr:diphosphate--fructose-6-phosphate 1-phosphotransferase [Bacillus sp. RAR_GA_16]MCA0172205.1 diphosphate--fructose-6-phosphate 1-phosphotransferase [Bacillus sp. RAR_GA_16]
MKKIAIGQAGGPTAVLNESFVGFLDEINQNVTGVLQGFQGLVEGRFIEMNPSVRDHAKASRSVSGAWLGAGRYTMSEADMSQAVGNLKKAQIDTLVFIGGNGTMWTLRALSKMAARMNVDLQVIGIPKTVDNDLAETDHAPGFGSAARYVAHAAHDMSKDLEAMQNFEQVRIIETMGRNVGWLAAASGLLKVHENEGPHFICLPEQKHDAVGLVEGIRMAIKEYGFASVVVSEGVKLDGGTAVGKIVKGREVLGGVSEQLGDLVEAELGVVARADNLGMNQRASQLACSKQDRIEAYQAGMKAAVLVREGMSDVMVMFRRAAGTKYVYALDTVGLDQVVAGGERALPEWFQKAPEAYYDWLRPLVREGDGEIAGSSASAGACHHPKIGSMGRNLEK